MKVYLLGIGRPRGAIAEAITEYEARVRRHFSFDALDLREEPLRSAGDVERVRNEEAKRLLARQPTGVEVVALHRGGDLWSSGRFSRYLSDLAVQGRGGAAFFIGGAFGLGDAVLDGASHRVSLSACTLPHDLARLVLTEQLYRAGTIMRGEPYHKGPAE